VDGAVVDRIADRIARTLQAGEAVPSSALRLLVRRFVATGRDEWRPGLQCGLSAATWPDGPGPAAPGWLHALADALVIADDDGLREAVRAQAHACRAAWPARGALRDAAWSVDACLAAAAALSDGLLLADAVDELERIVGLAYEPGEGVAQSLRTAIREPGDLATHVAAALALLRAFDVSGRLAYPMLAEELMQAWLPVDTGEVGPALEAARVLFQLAHLQEDADYRDATVTRTGAGYDRHGERILHAVSSAPEAPLGLAAAYGLAMEEWLRRT